MSRYLTLPILTLFLNMVTTTVFAYDIAVENEDGVTIYYNYVNNRSELEVTNGASSDYSGIVNIPKVVMYDGRTYNVARICKYAFYECIGIESITIPDSVTIIDDYAFYGCKNMISITIGSNVANIGDYVFEDCFKLEKVVVKDIAAWCEVKFGYSKIGDSNPLHIANHLYNDEDTEIKELAIPDGVVNIGSHAFNGCRGLISVTIPNSVVSIGDCAFQDCGLASITIPNSVTSIGVSAFSQCVNLTNISIPQGITSINHGTFWKCNALTSITIPNSVTSIGDYAFSYCKGLTSITIPDSVTTIGEGAFYCCQNLASLVVGSNVMDIDARAFLGCNNLKKVVVNDISAWCKINFNGGMSYYANPLQAAHHLYSDENTEVTELVIPNGVTSICDYAFVGCLGLTSVSIPQSINYIGQDAFAYCDSLKKVIVDDISSWCKVEFKYNPLFYAHHLYCDENTEITELVIPNDITSICDYAFLGCSNLVSVYIPQRVTIIGKYAFAGCSSLVSVTIPNSVTTISEGAFDSCTSLANVSLPNSITNIEWGVFWRCHALASVFIPQSVTNIGNYAFGYCRSLASVSIPQNVTSIGESAFMSCSSLTSITIPSGVKTIEQCAFLLADSLKEVISQIEVPFAIDDNVFSGSTHNATLRVPKGTIDNYKATDGWKDFANIKENLSADINLKKAEGILIRTEKGALTIEGIANDTLINVYNINGVLVGSDICKDRRALISTNLPIGAVAIVKVGNKSIRVIIR